MEPTLQHQEIRGFSECFHIMVFDAGTTSSQKRTTRRAILFHSGIQSPRRPRISRGSFDRRLTGAGRPHRGKRSDDDEAEERDRDTARHSHSRNSERRACQDDACLAPTPPAAPRLD